jgi:hypothetical protein
MYPRGELNALGADKARLRSRIAVRRIITTVLADRVLRPLGWLDRANGLWRVLRNLLTISSLFDLLP